MSKIKTTYEKKLRELHWTFYITLISIICSLAFTEFVAEQKSILANQCNYSFIPIFIHILKSLIVLASIIGTWHEYSIGTIFYSWVPDVRDSIIPFLIGISLFILIYQINHQPYYFFGALALFSFISIIAFFNQYWRSKSDTSNKLIFNEWNILHKVAFIACGAICVVSIFFTSIIYVLSNNKEYIIIVGLVTCHLIFILFIFKTEKIRLQLLKKELNNQD